MTVFLKRRGITIIMKQLVILLLFLAIAFASCKKHTDNNTTNPPSATLTMTVDSVPFQYTLLQDTVVIQLDTEIGSAYSNPVQFSIPNKRMVFIANGTDGSQLVWALTDFKQPIADTCLRSVAYSYNGSSNDYVTVYGTRFNSGFSLTYYINTSPHRYFYGDGGNITITSCDLAAKTVSGSFNVYTDNHDYPNEHHIIAGTFANVPFKVSVIPHYQQSMTATVNGSSWTANGISTVIGKTQDFGIINKGFRATGVSILDNSEIGISVFEAKNGNQGDCIRSTTFLDSKRSTDTTFANGYALLSVAIVDYITPDGSYTNLDSANIQITSCDETNKFITGTFSYYGKTADGTKSVAITNGRFTNLHYLVR